MVYCKFAGYSIVYNFFFATAFASAAPFRCSVRLWWRCFLCSSAQSAQFLPEMNFDRKSVGFGSMVSFQYRIMWVGCFHFSIVSCSSILPFITNISTILISVKSLCFKNSSRNLALHCSVVLGMLFESTEKSRKNKFLLHNSIIFAIYPFVNNWIMHIVADEQVNSFGRLLFKSQSSHITKSNLFKKHIKFTQSLRFKRIFWICFQLLKARLILNIALVMRFMKSVHRLYYEKSSFISQTELKFLLISDQLDLNSSWVIWISIQFVWFEVLIVNQVGHSINESFLLRIIDDYQYEHGYFRIFWMWPTYQGNRTKPGLV